jgi:hypothetical protein
LSAGELAAKHPGRRQLHRLIDAASAGGDDTKSHRGKDVNVVALRDGNLASTIAAKLLATARSLPAGLKVLTAGTAIRTSLFRDDD